MDDSTKNFWWKIWGWPLRSFIKLTTLSLLGGLLSFFIRQRLNHGPHGNDLWLLLAIVFFFALFLVGFLGAILSTIPRMRPWMSWVLRRWFFCGAVLATVIALFYAEENWRGQRAFERSQRELTARGAELDWNKFIPPAVPDDQNVFKAPKMQAWFVRTNRTSDSNELTALLRSPTNFPTWGTARKIESEAEARSYLDWSDRLQPQFNMIRDALKRPYSRMDSDYSQMFTMPIPNFIAIRELARVLAQRTLCHLLVHDPDAAVADLALIHDLSHLSDASPTGKPMTLVAAMINVAVVGLYADVIGKGFQMHAWQEPQLVELEKQLSEIHALPPVVAAFESEGAASARAIQTVPMKEIVSAFGSEANLFRIGPHGWLLQNIANETPFFYAHTEGLNAAHETVSPRAYKEAQERLEKFVSHRSLFNVLAALMVPNVQKAIQTTARNQNLVNEALVACALERYHLAHRQYPELLDGLAPQFIGKIPHDIINGGPLQYRRTDAGFVLYSVGWDEKDDGGAATVTKDGQLDSNSSDWVWVYSAK